MTIHQANSSNLQQIASIVNPGDIVELSSGICGNTWPESTVLEIRRSGTPGNPITFRPAVNAVPVIATIANWNGILVEGAAYIRLERLPVVGMARSIDYEDALMASKGATSPQFNSNGITLKNSHHVSVLQCSTTDMPGGGIYAVGCDYLTIERNKVTGCCMWSRYGQSGISIHLSKAIDARNTDTKIKVRWNECHGNSNLIPWEKTGKIQDGHGILFDENEAYLAPMLGQFNSCFGNGGLGVHRYKSPSAILKDNQELWNDRSNVTA